MELIIGSIVFLSSMLLLAVLSRFSSAHEDTAILRGDVMPAMLAVLISTGLTVGPLMMALGGEGYFPSRSIEFAVIVAFAVASIWIIAKFVGCAPRGLSA
ncbi:hypothetical protein [uncultured Hoeflea sp.]|uniref:hypothetical protein n=1 Tax=uncultured Hoeflea sp. TaxID=538666 RepID=UPI0030DA525D|tara:strand:- start:4353 stop:4652 length:300 start_codon:yes stop_codon:yes gene_type:complete